MFFVSSGNIAAEYPDLREVVIGLDRHLAAVGDSAILSDTVADFVLAEPALVDRLLKEYVRQGVLTTQLVYTCPECDQLLGLIRHGRELWCDVCDRTQSLRGKDLRGCTVYRVLPAASREAAAQSLIETPASSKTAILFIAGDRGGGQRVQLDQPGEEKALQRAIKDSKNSDHFFFHSPLYAAGPRQLVEGVEAGPGILHFVGHGSERRLLLVDPAQPLATLPVTPERLAELLKHSQVCIKLVYFNTCDSSNIASYLISSSVARAAVGWSGKISDTHAIQYVETFYRLACDGRPLEQAMQMAEVCLGESKTRPEMFVADGLDRKTYNLLL